MNLPPDDPAETLLHQSPVCIWALDRQLRIHRIYGNCALLFGVPAAGLRERLLESVLDPGELAAWRAAIERVFCGETASQRVSLGSRTFAVMHFPFRDGNGGAALAGGVAHEIASHSAVEEQLRKTALRALQSRDDERLRLAQLMHDDIGQCLSAAGLHLDLLRMDLETQFPDISARTQLIQGILERVMQSAREFSYELNPAVAERSGLHPALEKLAIRMRRKFLGQIRILEDPGMPLAPEIASALYKIAKEAIENAVEHSDAAVIEIGVKVSPEGAALEIRDDGRGFDAADPARCRGGLGLLVMEHYAAQGGLKLSIASPGKGIGVRAVYRKPAANGVD